MAESSKDCDCQPFSVLVANEYMLKINETMGNMIKVIVKKDKEYFKNNIKEALLDEIVEDAKNFPLQLEVGSVLFQWTH